MYFKFFPRIICTSVETNLTVTPPPLPPKRKTRNTSQHGQTICDDSDYLIAVGLDGVSLQSRSPEDSSSLLSASAGSLDSALNHSRDEDEMRGFANTNEDEVDDSMDLNVMVSMQGKLAECKNHI